MNLKKNDKIIAIIGVVILIVAAISVVFYVSSEDKSDEPDDTEDKMYEVIWSLEKGDPIEVDGTVGKTAYTEPISISHLDEGKVLSNVDVKLVWADDKTTILNTGKDELTVKISMDGEAEPITTKGSYNDTVASFNIHDKPSDDIYPVDEYELSEIESMIKQEQSGKNDVDLNVEITFKAGELLKFRDKGNDFMLIVTFNYYDYEIIDPLEDNNNEDDDDDDFPNTAEKESGDRSWSSTFFPLGKS